MKKYTYVNSSIVKGNVMPMYKVFDTETRVNSWIAYAHNKDHRGRLTLADQFSSLSRREVTDWRNIMGNKK